MNEPKGVDFVGIDDFFSVEGTFSTEEGHATAADSMPILPSDFVDSGAQAYTTGASPEYALFDGELQQGDYGSPESLISDEGGLGQISMAVEAAPFEATEPPAQHGVKSSTVTTADRSDDPFEEQVNMLVGKATANPLYDSNEALNQLHQAACHENDALPADPVAVAPATMVTTPAVPEPSSKKKRKVSRSSIKREQVMHENVPMAMPPPGHEYNHDGARRLLFTPRVADGGFTRMVNAEFHQVHVNSFGLDAEKGFNYSPIDNAHVCQKKNHFQVSLALSLSGVPEYVVVQGQYTPIEKLRLAVWGLKDEVPPAAVGIEQSHVDRSKRAFLPQPITLDKGAYNVVFNRLHFAETTSNNMRKKGKPNPDQRYFKLLVELHAVIAGEELVSLHCCESERIIVRASNPGQFDGEIDMKWQKGKTRDSIVHYGPVGINTDRPHAALTVNGNVSVTGQLLHPSDIRIKEHLDPKDNSEQLENIKKMRLYEYNVRESWAEAAGRDTDDRHEVGVIAQNVQQVLPDAVKETGANFHLKDGTTVDNLLIVDKDRIFMENVGAVQELCRMTENMDKRIHELELLQDAVTSGDYDECTPLDGDFSGEFLPPDGKKRSRMRSRKVKKANLAVNASTSWQQIPMKTKEYFPMERLLCYIVGVLTVFALLIVIVVLLAQKDEDSKGDESNPITTTIPMMLGASSTTTTVSF